MALPGNFQVFTRIGRGKKGGKHSDSRDGESLFQTRAEETKLSFISRNFVFPDLGITFQ